MDREIRVDARQMGRKWMQGNWRPTEEVWPKMDHSKIGKAEIFVAPNGADLSSPEWKKLGEIYDVKFIEVKPPERGVVHIPTYGEYNFTITSAGDFDPEYTIAQACGKLVAPPMYQNRAARRKAARRQKK